MPVIKDYQAASDPTGPATSRQAHAADTGGVGAAISQLGGTITDVGKLMAKREAAAETTDMVAKTAKAQADLQGEFDEQLMKANASDPHISRRFMERYDKVMGDIGDNLTTREAQDHFARSNAQMRGHMQMSSMKQQAKLNAEGAVNKLATSQSSWSTQVMRDPVSFETVKQQHSDLIETLSVPAETKLQLRAEGESKLAYAKFQGLNSIDPVFTKRLLDKDKKEWDAYFDSDQLKKIQHENDMAIHGIAVEKERKISQSKQMIAQRDDALGNAMLSKMWDGSLTPQQILNSKLSEPSLKLRYMHELENRVKGVRAASYDATVDAFTKRIQLPDDDPAKISNPNDLLGKGLDIKDLNMLRDEISLRHTPEGKAEAELKDDFYKEMRQWYVKDDELNGIMDPQGLHRFNQFKLAAEEEFAKQRKSGKNIRQLVNVKNPDYVGNLKSQFPRTDMETATSLYAPTAQPSALPQYVPSPTPVPAASSTDRKRRAGESAAQWRGRMGR